MVLARQVDPESLDSKVHEIIGGNVETPDPLISQRFHEEEAAQTLPAPKFFIHQSGLSPDVAAGLVRSHLELDGKTSLNLASFVHTGIEREGLELAKENITKNLADSDEYPALIELHQRCVSILSHLWNVPKGELGVGSATTGSSEAIMLGGLAMKRRWEARQRANGRPTDKPNIIMGANAQVALEKFARYFDVETRLLDVHAKDHFSFSLEDLKKNVDENTIGVFAILGSTYTGHYQDVEAISKVLDEVEAETGVDVPIHVDGASGAFVAPFLSPKLKWDFRLPRVKSINTSGHKFGLTPAGCGWIIWRDQKYLPENLLFTLSYLGGSEVSYTLNFSRPGHPIIYQYYNFVRLGFDGYYSIHASSLKNARVLSVFLEASGYFDVLSDIHRPRGKIYTKSGEQTYSDPGALKGKQHQFFNDGLPVVSFKLTDEFKKQYPYAPQEAISYMLRDNGYIVPNYPLPPAEEKYECLRIVINDNVSLDMLDMIMEDIIKVTNRLINVAPYVKGLDAKAVLKTIAVIAQADHSEEDHEQKWIATDSKNHSRC